jgi:hypothetical protein
MTAANCAEFIAWTCWDVKARTCVLVMLAMSSVLRPASDDVLIAAI